MCMANRMNLSIPDELKSRMMAATQPVNWSAIAARAFRSHLDQIDVRPAVPPALPEEVLESIVVAGEHSGRDWPGGFRIHRNCVGSRKSVAPQGTGNLARTVASQPGRSSFSSSSLSRTAGPISRRISGDSS